MSKHVSRSETRRVTEAVVLEKAARSSSRVWSQVLQGYCCIWVPQGGRSCQGDPVQLQPRKVGRRAHLGWRKPERRWVPHVHQTLSPTMDPFSSACVPFHSAHLMPFRPNPCRKFCCLKPSNWPLLIWYSPLILLPFRSSPRHLSFEVNSFIHLPFILPHGAPPLCQLRQWAF